jgi:hypothetical protein
MDVRVVVSQGPIALGHYARKTAFGLPNACSRLHPRQDREREVFWRLRTSFQHLPRVEELIESETGHKQSRIDALMP